MSSVISDLACRLIELRQRRLQLVAEIERIDVEHARCLREIDRRSEDTASIDDSVDPAEVDELKRRLKEV